MPGLAYGFFNLSSVLFLPIHIRYNRGMQVMLTDEQLLINIASNIQRLLLEREWTQSQLARETGLPQVTVNRICNGKNMPLASVLARIADAFRTSTDWLMAAHEENSRRTA